MLSPHAGAAAPLPRPIAFVVDHPVVVALAYFALHVGLRLVTGAAPGLDEAGEIVTTQALQWGYGPQPPLYSWLQWGVFRILGETLFALALLKCALLALTYLAVWRIGLRLTGDRVVAAAAMVGLVLLPQVGWESLRALSHTVLAVAIGAWVVDRFLMILAERRSRDYVVAGILIGLGIVSKYNFPLLPAALVIAALIRPESRAAILDRRMICLAVIALAVAAPHLIWAATHVGDVTSASRKFQLGARGFVLSRVIGTLGFLGATAVFVAPLAVVAAAVAVLFRRREGAAAPVSEATRVLATMLMVVCALILVAVLVSGTTNVKDRWLQPVLFPVAAVIAALLLPRVDRRGVVALFAASGIAAVAIAIAIVHNGMRLEQPASGWRDIAAAARRAAPDARSILAERYELSGRLRWVLDMKPAGDLELGALKVATPAPAVLIWYIRDADKAPPKAMLDLAAARVGPGSLGEVVEVTAPDRADGSRMMRLGLARYAP